MRYVAKLTVHVTHKQYSSKTKSFLRWQVHAIVILLTQQLLQSFRQCYTVYMF